MYYNIQTRIVHVLQCTEYDSIHRLGQSQFWMNERNLNEDAGVHFFICIYYNIQTSIVYVLQYTDYDSVYRLDIKYTD